jgi:hypothetical protein
MTDDRLHRSKRCTGYEGRLAISGAGANGVLARRTIVHSAEVCKIVSIPGGICQLPCEISVIWHSQIIKGNDVKMPVHLWHVKNQVRRGKINNCQRIKGVGIGSNDILEFGSGELSLVLKFVRVYSG